MSFKYCIEILQVNGKPSDILSYQDFVQEANKVSGNVDDPLQFSISQIIQNKTNIQITSKWDNAKESARFEHSPKINSLSRVWQNMYSKQVTLYHASLNRPQFGPDGATTANVIEFAQTWFPVSQLTPEFETQIEDDFSRFNDICGKEAKGNFGWSAGWILEEQFRDAIDGQAKSFVVLRNWESMDNFKRLVKSVAVGEAIQILIAWNAPSTIVRDLVRLIILLC